MMRGAWIFLCALPLQVALLTLIAYELTGVPMGVEGVISRAALGFALATSIAARDLRLSISCLIMYGNNIVPQILGGVLSPGWDEPVLFALNLVAFYWLFRLRFPTAEDHARERPLWLLIPYATYLLALPIYIFAPLTNREQFFLTNGAAYLTVAVIAVVGIGRIGGWLMDRRAAI